MRFYQKTADGIEAIDFRSKLLKRGKIIFRFGEEDSIFYYYCIKRDKKIRLHDIKKSPRLCVTPQYSIYNPGNESFTGNEINDGIRVEIPLDFELTEHQLQFVAFWKKSEEMRQYFATLPSADNTFQTRLMRVYHNNALQSMASALLRCNLIVLQETLKNHWDIINGNALCYTAIPKDPITCLFCDIAEFLAPKLNLPAIALLMPTIATESQFANFPHLTAMRAHDIIRTHMLGPKGVYLIPMGMLAAEKSASPEDQKSDYPLFDIATVDPYRLMSPYYDVAKHDPSNCYLDSATVSRLEKYAPATEIFFDAKKQYMRLIDAKENLLGQLLRLANLLKYNSAHGGIGQQKEAAQGGFVAIANFFEYYNVLTAEQKALIPAVIHAEIKMLLNFAAPKYNSDGKYINLPKEQELATCIGTRGEALSSTLHLPNNQAILARISLTPETKEKSLHDARAQFLHAQESIQRNIKDADFYGRDSLGITNALLRYFNLSEHFHIRTDEALKQLMQSEPNEIKTLCEVPHLPGEIIRVINNLENLIMLIHDHADDRITVLLQMIGSGLMDINTGIITTLEHFEMLLQTFEADRITVLLSALSGHLAQLIRNGDRLSTLLLSKKLIVSHHTQILSAISGHLSRLIQNGEELVGLIVHNILTPEDRTQILNAVQNQLAQLIQTPYQLSILLSTQKLTASQHQQIWNAVQPNLTNFIQNVDQLNTLLSQAHLTELQRVQIGEALSIDQWRALLIKKDLLDSTNNIIKSQSSKAHEQTKVFSTCDCGLFSRRLTSNVTKLQLYFVLRLIEVKYEQTGGGSSAQKLKALIQDIINAKSDNNALQKMQFASFSRSRLANAFELLLTQLEKTDQIIIDDVLDKLVTEKHSLVRNLSTDDVPQFFMPVDRL